VTCKADVQPVRLNPTVRRLRARDGRLAAARVPGETEEEEERRSRCSKMPVFSNSNAVVQGGRLEVRSGSC
jgi:hypothetical protein